MTSTTQTRVHPYSGAAVRALVVAGWAVLLGPAWGPAPAVRAAERKPPSPTMPFADPQSMLDLFFGEPTEEERQKLAQIDVTPEEERRAGKAVVDSFLDQLRQQGIRVHSRGRDVDYIRELVDVIRPLLSNGDRYPRIAIYVARSRECNARSFPGGTLVFFQGLLESCGSEAALLGMIGHELSHLDRGHHLWRIRRMKLGRQMFSGGAPPASAADFFTSGAAVFRLWTRPFSPELEAEADRDGAQWAYRSGYDPREMARLFLKRDDPGSRRVTPAIFASHPALRNRHDAVMRQFKELQRLHPRKDLYIGRENLRRRVTRNRRAFAE